MIRLIGLCIGTLSAAYGGGFLFLSWIASRHDNFIPNEKYEVKFWIYLWVGLVVTALFGFLLWRWPLKKYGNDGILPYSRNPYEPL